MNKKFLLLLIINLSFLIFNSEKIKAQYVTIPDANFVTWLTANCPGCMIFDQMYTSCNAALNTTTVDVSNQNISDLTGIEYFVNLTSLKCNFNNLLSIPTLPNSLQTLECVGNQLTSLPTLPNSLTTLKCGEDPLQNGIQNAYGNNLTNLPGLPNGLEYLDCSKNQLTSLPVIPNSLKVLVCSYNPIGNLPVLPNTLTLLICNQNQLNSLPSLPDSLYVLGCSLNYLTALPALHTRVVDLRCFGNQLTSLPPLISNVQYLDCSFNLISNIQFLPNTIYSLNCRDNQLTSLPALPSSLGSLGCENNLLSNLPTLPTSLSYLRCDNNQLINLPILPNTLNSFSCSSNQLTNLIVSQNSFCCINDFNCSNNQLSNIPSVPNQMYAYFISNNNISCLPNLPQVSWLGDISNNPLTCVPNQTSYSLGLPFCTDNDPINNSGNCAGVNITGNVYKDLDGFCTYDNYDWKTENIPVKLYDNQSNLLAMSYTINGVYSFSALQPDSFKVIINDVALPLDMGCGQANNQTVQLDSANQTIANINFPVVCDSAFDMQVHAVTRQGWVFPGQVHTVNTNLANDVNWYNLNYSNSTYSGTVTININGPVTYVAPAVGALTPQVSGNTFTYTISDFDSISLTSFGLQLATDTTAQTGQQICVNVAIATTPTDADTTNNTYTFCYNVINSYDPNMKEVYPTNVLPGYNDWFTYTIHFQNTGTAPAFNIRLRDTLDTQLDLNTFEFLGASHTATTALNGRMLNIRFNNIMLPDSTSNYQGSMGYYQYRIKPLQNLPNGSNIKNTAYIYFDYNPAIITNTTQNNFDVLTSNRVIARRNDEAISIFPNPSSGIFTLNTSTTIKTVEVFNIMGESVLQQTTGNKINISSQPKGIYFAKVNGELVVKLVKE